MSPALAMISILAWLATSIQPVATSPSYLRTKSVDWKDVPGKPIRAHAGSSIQFQQLFFAAQRKDGLRWNVDVEHNPFQMESFVVKFQRSRQNNLKSAIQAMYQGAVVQYLPHDSFITALPPHVAEKVSELDDVLAVFLLPPELKLHPEVMGEVSGKLSNYYRRSSKDEDRTASHSGVTELSVMIGRSSDQGGVESVWRARLAQVGLSEAVVRISDSGRGAVTVTASEEHVPTVTKWLAELGEVLWVQRKPRAQLYAHEEVAMDGVGAAAGDATLQNIFSVPGLLGAEASDGQALVWSKGVRGQGQVIAVVDSGLDFDNCAFSDAAGGAELIAFCTGNETCAAPKGHRKVHSYRMNQWQYWTAQAGDEPNGHGTHVVGSAVGNVLGDDPGFQMKGVAPEAKVAFEDSVDESLSDALLIDDDPMSDLFQPSADQGMRVHSNSWGKWCRHNACNTGEIRGLTSRSFHWNRLFGPVQLRLQGPGGGRLCVQQPGLSHCFRCGE